MKIKKPSAVTILLAVTAIVYIAASLLFCYTTKPAVTTGEFPFSITYVCNGETKTLSGVMKCEYSGSSTIQGEHKRYWHQTVTYDNPENLEYPFVADRNEELETTLSVYENMDAGYFMGDPQKKDYYKAFGYDSAVPQISYQDYKNDIFLGDAAPDDIPESLGFEIVGYTYASPIENRFSFSGIRYAADNIIIFVAIMLVMLLLCLIIIRRDKSLRYSRLDKAGIVLNFLVAVFVVPPVSFLCMLFGIVESDYAIVDQIIYNIPPFAVLCLALSVVFRRKGYSKTGFFIQFGGIVSFVLILILEEIFRFH